MISKRAKKAFLNRKLNSFDWLKKHSKADINEALNELDPPPKLKFGRAKLWIHQRVCFLIMWELKRFLVFLDMGNGKTLLTLALINYRKMCGEKPRAVIFVPYITAVETWVDEVKLRTPNLTCIPLLGSSKDNLKVIQNNKADLFVVCYQSAVAMCSKKTTTDKKGKTKWSFEAKDVKKVFKSFDMLVMDEVHKVKSPSSLTYRMCRAISKQCEWAFGLTGTPFGRDLTDLWSQFYVVDLGETLGETLGLYREAFFTQSINHWGGYVYKFKQNMFPTLQKMIKNASIRYSVEECHDMPKKKYIPKHVNLPESVEAYYEKGQEKLQKLIAAKKRDYKQIQSAYIQLRQLSSGFMTFKGDDSKNVEVTFESNPKLEYLIELIESLPEGKKMVVFHNYVYSNFLISGELTKHKIKHARIWGGQKDKIGELRRFKKDKNCTVIVINSKSGSSSLNLQFANYIAFFEQPDSPIDRTQAERRVWRPGQLLPVFIYDIFVRGTHDEKHWGYNQQGKDFMSALLDGKEKV